MCMLLSGPVDSGYLTPHCGGGAARVGSVQLARPGPRPAAAAAAAAASAWSSGEARSCSGAGALFEQRWPLPTTGTAGCHASLGPRDAKPSLVVLCS